VDNLVSIDLWVLGRRAGDFKEPCEIISCNQVARTVAVISYSDGSASIRSYCPEHEGRGAARLKRNFQVEPVDHRQSACDPTLVRIALGQSAKENRSRRSVTRPELSSIDETPLK